VNYVCFTNEPDTNHDETTVEYLPKVFTIIQVPYSEVNAVILIKTTENHAYIDQCPRLYH